jgi:lipoprotein signal peptidase
MQQSGVEMWAFCTNIVVILAKFLYEHILMKFGCQLTIVTNQGTLLSMMQSDTLLTTLSLYILVLLFIIHKEMDRLSLQINIFVPY